LPTIVACLLAAAVLLSGCSGDREADTRQARRRYEAGAGFINQRLYEKAVEQFDLAIKFDPDYAEAYCDRGIARYMMGEHEWALRDFELAIEKDPTLGKAHFHRAILLDQDGKTEEAIGAYEDFIRNSQRSPAVYVQRANKRLVELRDNAPPLSR
jgi:tetratricopeptide (TPR) repeat protein